MSVSTGRSSGLPCESQDICLYLAPGPGIKPKSLISAKHGDSFLIVQPYLVVYDYILLQIKAVSEPRLDNLTCMPTSHSHIQRLLAKCVKVLNFSLLFFLFFYSSHNFITTSVNFSFCINECKSINAFCKCLHYPYCVSLLLLSPCRQGGASDQLYL